VTEVLERWRSEAGRNGRAAAGWDETLEAASDGRVDLLLVEQDANHEAYRCAECGRASANPGSCPVHGRELEHQQDGLDLVLHHVLAYGGVVVPVEGNALAGDEGIGALLRF
jgi:peptide subunit release factor 1 (eRF1)